MKLASQILKELKNLAPRASVTITRHEGENDGMNWVAAAGAGLTDEESKRFAQRIADLRKSDPKILFD